MQVFILGTGRSGTSIFNRVIGCHADIWSFKWESQIFSGLPALVDVADAEPTSVLVEKFALRARQHLYKRSVGGRYDAGLFELIDKDELDKLLDELVVQVKQSACEEDRLRACVQFSDAIFQVSANKESKYVWCEKTPRNLLYADKLQKLYPNAKFINVVRDGREVVSSILEKKFWPIAKSNRFEETLNFGKEVSLFKAVNYWCTLMSISEKMKRRVGEGNWLDIRLEDLGKDLQGVQLAIENFIGTSRDENFLMLASTLVSEKRADKQRWMLGRTDQEIAFMQKEMCGHLVKFNYDV